VLKAQHSRRRKYSDGIFLETETTVIVPKEVHKFDVGEGFTKSSYINTHK
jgi:hypothetical protein